MYDVYHYILLVLFSGEPWMIHPLTNVSLPILTKGRWEKRGGGGGNDAKEGEECHSLGPPIPAFEEQGWGAWGSELLALEEQQEFLSWRTNLLLFSFLVSLCDPWIPAPQAPCPLLSPEVCLNSCPLSRWCHLILSPPPPPAFSLSQHQGLFQWVNSLHEVAKVLESQL